MSLFEQQRDILFEACKTVATNKKCPEWIVVILRDAVLKAKNLKEDFPTLGDEKQKTLEIGSIVKSRDKKDNCLYKIVAEEDMIENVRLFDVAIVEGNKENPVGYIIHNVPETFLSVEN